MSGERRAMNVSGRKMECIRMLVERRRMSVERRRMLVESQRTERERRAYAKGTRSYQERYFYCRLFVRFDLLTLF